jgi:hypothetical protein
VAEEIGAVAMVAELGSRVEWEEDMVTVEDEVGAEEEEEVRAGAAGEEEEEDSLRAQRPTRRQSGSGWWSWASSGRWKTRREDEEVHTMFMEEEKETNIWITEGVMPRIS